MGVSKVIHNGTVLIDLSSDTISPETMLEGVTGHDKYGNVIVGTCVSDDKYVDLVNTYLDDILGEVLEEDVNE